MYRRLRGTDATGRSGAAWGQQARWKIGLAVEMASQNRRGWPIDGDPKEGPWIRADGPSAYRSMKYGKCFEWRTDTAVYLGDFEA